MSNIPINIVNGNQSNKDAWLTNFNNLVYNTITGGTFNTDLNTLYLNLFNGDAISITGFTSSNTGTTTNFNLSELTTYFLPLSGGSMSGDVVFKGYKLFTNNEDTSGSLAEIGFGTDLVFPGAYDILARSYYVGTGTTDNPEVENLIGVGGLINGGLTLASKSYQNQSYINVNQNQIYINVSDYTQGIAIESTFNPSYTAVRGYGVSISTGITDSSVGFNLSTQYGLFDIFNNNRTVSFNLDNQPISNIVSLQYPTTSGRLALATEINISNNPYNYSSWSGDTISGATREAIANKFNSIDYKRITLSVSGLTNIDLSTNNYSIINQNGVLTLNGVNTTNNITNQIIIINGDGVNNINIPTGWTSTNNILTDPLYRNRIDISCIENMVYYSVIKSQVEDTTAPVLESINVTYSNLSQIILTYNEPLKNNIISSSVFVLTGKTISSVSVTGNTVLINVTTPYNIGDSAVISYNSPLSNGIEDILGNKAISFSNELIDVFDFSLYDTFNRSNNLNSVGMPDFGESYSANTGTWGITGNTLFCSSALQSGANVGNVISNLSGGTSTNQELSLDITWGTLIAGQTSTVGLITRFTNINNFMLVSLARVQNTNNLSVTLFKVVGGTFTSVVVGTTLSGIVGGSTHNYKFIAQGNTYTVKQDDITNTIINNYVDNSITSGNGVGIRLVSGLNSSGNLDRFDNLTVNQP